MFDRHASLARFAYGPAWLDAGAVSDRLLEEHAADPETPSPEHCRWAMFLWFERNLLRRGMSRETLEKVLAVDAEESREGGLGHSIAHHLAKTVTSLDHIDRLFAHDVGSNRKAYERHLLESALEIEKRNHARTERPRSQALRLRSLEQSPGAVLRSLGEVSPLEAMLELSSAWGVSLASVEAAGAFARGELSEEALDAALIPVRDAASGDWKLALRIADALARDVIDRETAALARARPIQTIRGLMLQADLGLGAAKSVLGHLEQLGEGMYEPGALSRVIAEERARAERMRAR